MRRTPNAYWRAVIEARAVQVEMPLHVPPTIVSDRKYERTGVDGPLVEELWDDLQAP